MRKLLRTTAGIQALNDVQIGICQLAYCLIR